MEILGDPSTTSDWRVAADDQSVVLADGDEREALRRHAAQSGVQADRLVTKARELEEWSTELCADAAELARRPSKLAPRPSELREERAPRPAQDRGRGVRAAAEVLLYAGLAVLVGLLAEWIKDPPTVVTVIIVVTFFGALLDNHDAPLEPDGARGSSRQSDSSVEAQAALSPGERSTRTSP